LRHGVSATTIAHYPAYGAIVDSVLLGAHPHARRGDPRFEMDSSCA
jgi:hypothetical protein